MKLWFRGCPKCGGDLTEEADILYTVVYCIQCGYQLGRSEETSLRRTGHMPGRLPVGAAVRKSA